MELSPHDRRWMRQVIEACRAGLTPYLTSRHTFTILCGLDVRTPFDETLMYGEKLLAILEVRDRLAK